MEKLAVLMLMSEELIRSLGDVANTSGCMERRSVIVVDHRNSLTADLPCLDYSLRAYVSIHGFNLSSTFCNSLPLID